MTIVNTILVPSMEQIQWADCEVGVIIHLDLQVFDPDYEQHYDAYDNSCVKLFDPDRLDTDQWLAAAKSAGAKYAVLTAKHGTGFTLFPTEANPISIANAPYKNGKGDVVADFIASCKRFGIRPGFYFNTSYNRYYGIRGGLPKDGDPAKLEYYNRAIMQQLEDLWSRYGEFFEIWFDGGCLPPEQGGPDLVPLLQKYQPRAITFQSPPSVPNGIRWVGNERATAEYNCWATVEYSRDSFDGVTEVRRQGDPWGELWRPAEADTPGREASRSYAGGWIWKEGEDHTVIPGEELFAMYLESVGRNCNLLIGMGIDRHGLLPEADAKALARLGELVTDAFGTPLANYEGSMNETVYHLQSPDGKFARYLVVMEDITYGERVLRFHLDNGIEGCSIGHKRIIPLPEGTKSVTFTVDESKDTPMMRSVCLY